MSVLLVTINPGPTADDFLDQMRKMRTARIEKTYENIVCTLAGFQADRRDLCDIPEAVHLCKRLVGIGLISFLDLSTCFPPHQDALVRQGYGALEVWLTAKGLMRKFTKYVFSDFQIDLAKENEKADKLIGPMEWTPPTDS